MSAKKADNARDSSLRDPRGWLRGGLVLDAADTGDDPGPSHLTSPSPLVNTGRREAGEAR